MRIRRVVMMVVVMIVVVIMVVMMMVVVICHLQPAEPGAERIAKRAIGDV